MDFSEKINPSHTAVVVIDVQRDYFCAGGIIDLMKHDYRANQAIIPGLKAFIEEARRHLRTIIFTRQTMYPFLRSPVAAEHYTRAKMARPFDPRNEEFYECAPTPEDIVLPKHRYSAFIGTPLDAILRANGIRTLILTGVATNVCVESTARDGFMLDYHIVLPSDLTAGVNDQAKQMSLLNINTFFGEVVESDSIVSAWEKNFQEKRTNVK